jgi:hypothetical protein
MASGAAYGCLQSESPYGLGPGAGTGDGDGDGDGTGPGDGSGDGDGDGPSGSSGGPGTGARAYFDDNVLPMLASSCASCHSSQHAELGPDFLGRAEDVYYGSLDFAGYITVPDNSLLLLKGEHTGPAWTSAQADAVTQWLDLEAAERGLTSSTVGEDAGAPPPTLTLQDALSQFAACMSLSDWNNVGMDGVADQGTTEGPCRSCHQTGTGGAFLSEDSTQSFEQNRQMPYILKLVLGTVSADGSFADLVPANRFVEKGGEGGLHPKYIMTPERQIAISLFFEATYDKWKSGGCPP